jgi:DNA topoisomerase-1
MTDSTVATADAVERRPTARRAGRATSPEALAKRLGLRMTSADELTIRRRRSGRGFSYQRPDGSTIRDKAVVKRLASLAVPPAYEDVLYAEDPSAHLQAVGRDAAGRLQYRYHPEWEKVREIRKARRLARLAEALPRIRRVIAQHLGGAEPTREFTLAAVIELVASSAIRPGSEQYAKMRGTRGAATLLKSNVRIAGDIVTLSFRAKGGKSVVKELRAPRLGAALNALIALPGRRLFQYRHDNDTVRGVTARMVNIFLREIAAEPISLKDFRTLLASVSVLDALSRETPAESKRARRRQVLEAIRTAADDLANTPTICGKSYVHEAVVNAFEEGILEKFAETLRGCRTPSRGAKALAEILNGSAVG